LGELVFGETNGVNNAVSGYRKADVQKCPVLPLLSHCLPVFEEICGKTVHFEFFVQVKLIKTVRIYHLTGHIALSVID